MAVPVTNYNEAYNVRTFFRDLPLGEAKLLLALISGELDERSMAATAAPAPAKTTRRGRPAGSRNKKAAPQPSHMDIAPTMAEAPTV